MVHELARLWLFGVTVRRSTVNTVFLIFWVIDSFIHSKPNIELLHVLQQRINNSLHFFSFPVTWIVEVHSCENCYRITSVKIDITLPSSCQRLSTIRQVLTYKIAPQISRHLILSNCQQIFEKRELNILSMWIFTFPMRRNFNLQDHKLYFTAYTFVMEWNAWQCKYYTKFVKERSDWVAWGFLGVVPSVIITSLTLMDPRVPSNAGTSSWPEQWLAS